MLNFNMSLKLDDVITREIQWYVKAKLPEIINEYFFENPEKLDKIIQSAVASQIKSACNEVLQGKDMKEILKQKVLEKLC